MKLISKEDIIDNHNRCPAKRATDTPLWFIREKYSAQAQLNADIKHVEGKKWAISDLLFEVKFVDENSYSEVADQIISLIKGEING